MTTKLMNLPNLLTALRFPLVPVMLYLAWTGTDHAFNALLILSLLIDAVDGWLARRLHCAGEFGARLDSWADLVTWLALPICAWWLNPDALRREMPFLAVAVGFYLVAVGIGLVKFRRLTSYHTRGAKFMAMAAAVAVGIFFLARTGIALRVLTPVVVLAEAEEILITLVLPRWQSDVPTLKEAWRLRTRLQSAGPQPAKAVEMEKR